MDGITPPPHKKLNFNTPSKLRLMRAQHGLSYPLIIVPWVDVSFERKLLRLQIFLWSTFINELSHYVEYILNNKSEDRSIKKKCNFLSHKRIYMIKFYRLRLFGDLFFSHLKNIYVYIFSFLLLFSFLPLSFNLQFY